MSQYILEQQLSDQLILGITVLLLLDLWLFMMFQKVLWLQEYLHILLNIFESKGFI